MQEETIMSLKRRTVLLIGFIFIGAALVISCGGQGTHGAGGRATTHPDGSPIRLAWIGKTLNNPWWISVADFARSEAASLGVELTIALPLEEVDLERQVAMVDAAILQGVDAIIISAVSSEGIIPAIMRARAAGITIINFDTRIADPAMLDAFVGADDVYGAYKAGRFIAAQIGGQGTVGLITGLLAQSTGVDRREGFLRAVANYPGITVVEHSADWRSDLAANVTNAMLTTHPDIRAIFASNDQMAVGMVSAVRAAGRRDGMVLVGYDGILDAVNLVLDGGLDAFVALPNIEQAQIGVRLAVAKLLNPNYTFAREMIFPTPLVTYNVVPGHTDRTIYEFTAMTFPLRGITATGY